MKRIKLTKKSIANLQRVYENLSDKIADIELVETDSNGISTGLLLICKFEGFSTEIDITDYESW